MLKDFYGAKEAGKPHPCCHCATRRFKQQQFSTVLGLWREGLPSLYAEGNAAALERDKDKVCAVFRRIPL
jgi:hypothetical protein